MRKLTLILILIGLICFLGLFCVATVADAPAAAPLSIPKLSLTSEDKLVAALEAKLIRAEVVNSCFYTCEAGHIHTTDKVVIVLEGAKGIEAAIDGAAMLLDRLAEKNQPERFLIRELRYFEEPVAAVAVDFAMTHY